MTIEEVLKVTALILKNINVPVWCTEQIAVPIMNAVHNLD